MIKKKLKSNFILILLGFAFTVFTLVACAAATSSDTSTTTSTQSEGQTQGEFTLSQPLKLAIGTLKLEGTSLAVDADQAAALLPLWQAYDSLSTSSTAAQVEVDAVLGQIEESMTPEQLKSIDDMGLTGQSMGEVFQSLGIDSNFGRQNGLNGTPDPSFIATRQAEGGFQGGRGGDFAPGDGAVFVRPEGGGQGGGFGPGGGFAPGGTPDPELMATRQAMAGGFTGSGRVNPALYQALIDLLQSKINS